jgi:hypothetical protein
MYKINSKWGVRVCWDVYFIPEISEKISIQFRMQVHNTLSGEYNLAFPGSSYIIHTLHEGQLKND